MITDLSFQNMVDRVKEKDPWRETHEWKQYLSPD